MPGAMPVAAFTADTYTGRSVLADGRWVSTEISESGPVLLTSANLARWGFADPSRIRVFGAGGHKISDHLSAANYADNLPQVATALTPA